MATNSPITSATLLERIGADYQQLGQAHLTLLEIFGALCHEMADGRVLKPHELEAHAARCAAAQATMAAQLAAFNEVWRRVVVIVAAQNVGRDVSERVM